MKVSELTGAMLGYWVAKAEGLKSPEIVDGVCQYVRHDEPGDDGWWTAYDPSEEWGIAGPIIERALLPMREGGGEGIWRAPEAYKCQFVHSGYVGEGPTILIAAMRAYVASKFGEEVPEVSQKEGT